MGLLAILGEKKSIKYLLSHWLFVISLSSHEFFNYSGYYTLFSCFRDLGFSVLRFNFRSVGRSQGTFEDGPGELADATAALDWLQQHNPDARQCWIAGYSFGSWVALQLLMRRPDINNFIAVSPPANEKDFSFLAPCPTSGLIIQGGADEIGNPAMVTSLAKRLNMQRHVDVDYALIEEGDHMYNNHLVDLYKVTGNYILDVINRVTPQKKRRGRRKKSDMIEDETLMLEDQENQEDLFDDDFDDEEI